MEPGLIKRLIRSKLVQDIGALFGTQVATFAAPLITIPYLARVLGPSEWGFVAFAQGFGWYIVMVVEYGFVLSGTREVSRYRNDPERLSEILAGVLGAKLVLAALGLAMTLLMFLFVPALHARPQFLAAAYIWALSQALNMSWFYQGLELIKKTAAFDLGTKIASCALTFLLVRKPTDGWKVLAILAVCALTSMVVLLFASYKRVRFQWPSMRLVGEALRLGWSMFLFRSSLSLFAVGNSLILGFFAAPIYVGYYAGAEKLHKALQSLTMPISQSVYPRLTNKIIHSRREAISLARKAAALMFAVGLSSGAFVYVFAPQIVRILLGPGFAPSADVLRVFAICLPLIALSNLFGGQWMLPLGLESLFTRIILVTGILNIVIACVTASRFAHMGMVWTVTGCELFETVALYIALRRRGLDPLGDRTKLLQNIDLVMETPS